jgi:hypothetical protein
MDGYTLHHNKLNSKTTVFVKLFQLQLKQQLITTINFEHSLLTTKMLNELCESLLVIVELFMEALEKNPELTHDMVLTCLQQHIDIVLKQIDMSPE